MTDPNPTPDPAAEPKGEKPTPEQTFTQADVDRMEAVGGDGAAVDDGSETFTQADVDAAVEKIAAKIRAEERQKVSKKYEERIAALEAEVESSKREALRRRVQAAHGISDEDADLFLTGTDEDALTAQAKRLADRESERKKNGNHVPREGNNPKPGGDDDMRAFTRDLFSRAAGE